MKLLIVPSSSCPNPLPNPPQNVEALEKRIAEANKDLEDAAAFLKKVRTVHYVTGTWRAGWLNCWRPKHGGVD